ncbi:MAG TPA: c-type cytochrome [Nitrospirae bacterium]|nr:c-type cytochrome [Nitrospirota bacterium]
MLSHVYHLTWGVEPHSQQRRDKAMKFARSRLANRWHAGGLSQILFILPIALVLLATASLAFAQGGASAAPVDYRDVPYVGSRNVIWILAEVHLLFGGFVLGVPVFAWICDVIGTLTKEERYNKLANDFIGLTLAAFEMTAMLGATFLLFLLALYPKVVNYMTGIFWPTYYVYVMLFGASMVILYLYWSGFQTMKNRKGLHLFIGFLLNLIAVGVMLVPNAWATFQASPVVLPGGMGALEKAWAAMNNPTWGPVNIHRFISNIVLGGFLVGAYSGVRYLGARTQEEREHYDWMGYIGNFIGMFGLLTLPFAGYWLMREVYMYNQQMGITLMGGFLSWLFIIQAVLIGILFLGANYYFWLGLAYRTEGAERYMKPILILLTALLSCFMVWLTPHSLVASIAEARAMGGAHHPLLGLLGVMSAKMTVVNLMILISFVSFLMYWRAGSKPTASWAKVANVLIVILFFVVIVGVIVIGVWGYFVPAIVRINVFSVTQVLAVLTVLLTVTPLVGFMLKGAKSTSKMTFGVMPVRSQLGLIVNAVTIVFTMSLMGYARSASRVHWHIYGVLEDTSPYAFSPALGHAGAMAALATFLFFALVGIILWITISASRSSAFSTQYFFLAPFIFWATTLTGKPVEPSSGPSGQVVEQPKFIGKVAGTICGVLLLFIWISNSVPQMQSLPPKKVAFDVSNLNTKADLVDAGKKLFFGKAQCALCHSLEHTESPRCPVMKGRGAKRTREYILESMMHPKAVIYKQYETAGPGKFYPAQMPVINKPPIGLSDTEMLAVVSFIQSLGGKVTVEPSELKALVAGTGKLIPETATEEATTEEATTETATTEATATEGNGDGN